MILYFPPKETAGFATFAVRQPSLLPCPPARSIAIILFFTFIPPRGNRPFFVSFNYIKFYGVCHCIFAKLCREGLSGLFYKGFASLFLLLLKQKYDKNVLFEKEFL